MSIINTVECRGAQAVGTGVEHCTFDPDEIKKYIEVSGSISNIELSRDEIIRRVQAGEWIPSKRVFLTEPQHAENQFEEQGGAEALASLGRYKYLMRFQADAHYHNVLAKNRSNGTKSIHFVDQNGALWGTDPEFCNPYATNHITPVKLEGKTSTTSSKTGVVTQLAEPTEIDGDFAWIPKEKIGFNLLKLTGLNTIKFQIQSITTTTAKVKLVLAGDNFTTLKGLDGLINNFRVMDEDGNLKAISEVKEVVGQDGVYEFTFAAVDSGKAITIELFDTVKGYPSIVIDNGGENVRFYNGAITAKP